ncbi:hypothetical protein T484DRAFT_1810494 [Baffinella frigidus]|nr:hypothetical protein T484DRAFT_1810494 [Cryptophyta sp. CCMP2293]
MACESGVKSAAQVVAECLRLGADPLAGTLGEGNTPLHFAALGGGAEVIRALCIGPNTTDAHAWSSEWNFTLGVNASDTVNASSGNATSGQSAEGDGVVPMDVGEGDGLVANGTAWGDGGDALKNASTNATGDAPPVDERWGLLRNSKFAEWKVEAERDALHAAATAVLNPRPVVERYPLFCRASADARLQRMLDMPNKGGATALHLAATFGQEKAVLSLLQLGANPRLLDAEGQTPADCLDDFDFSNARLPEFIIEEYDDHAKTLGNLKKTLRHAQATFLPAAEDGIEPMQL